MNEAVKKVLIILGAILAVYIFFTFLLPLIITVLTGVFVVIKWIIIAVLVFMAITYIVNLVKSR